MSGVRIRGGSGGILRQERVILFLGDDAAVQQALQELQLRSGGFIRGAVRLGRGFAAFRGSCAVGQGRGLCAFSGRGSVLDLVLDPGISPNLFSR